MQTQRIDINKIMPGAYQPLVQMMKNVENGPLPKNLFNLIYVRGSIINGCAFCIQSHSKDAIASGETPKRIFALNSWEHSPYFSEEEKAVLALTDEATLIVGEGVSDKVFNNAVELLGEEKVSHAIMAIACINALNRIGKATLLIPE
jgi:AhpD family alkylhydroperoxidase